MTFNSFLEVFQHDSKDDFPLAAQKNTAENNVQAHKRVSRSNHLPVNTCTHFLTDL